MNPIKAAMNFLSPRLQAPIPENDVINTPDKMAVAQRYQQLQQENMAITRIRQARPELKTSDEMLRTLYRKYGDKIVPGNQEQTQPTQSILGAVIQKIQNSAQAQAAPQPTIYPGFENRNPQIQQAIKSQFGNISPTVANQAINMAARESGLNPGNVHKNSDYVQELGGPTTDYGLYQINDYWQRENLKKYGYTIKDMLVPQKAIDFAKKIYQAQGNQWGNTWNANQELGYR